MSRKNRVMCSWISNQLNLDKQLSTISSQVLLWTVDQPSLSLPVGVVRIKNPIRKAILLVHWRTSSIITIIIIITFPVVQVTARTSIDLDGISASTCIHDMISWFFSLPGLHTSSMASGDHHPSTSSSSEIKARVSSWRSNNAVHPVDIDIDAGTAVSAPSPVVCREVKHFKKWKPLLVPCFILANTVVFVMTMYVNNCPQNSVSCVAKFLGRFSFQPFKENPLLGPSSSTWVSFLSDSPLFFIYFRLFNLHNSFVGFEFHNNEDDDGTPASSFFLSEVLRD